ncbi:hypothetical protein ACRAWC_20635 [Leifsonia sp. L25]|uniref:hypothetical protein n=1 Tax=Leifsonia sp. L25 TaxID=3423957 RepID=UPI003D68B288
MTGVATAKSLLGPWYTKAKKPLISTPGTGGRYLGPGGEDLVTSTARTGCCSTPGTRRSPTAACTPMPVSWRDGLPELSK